MPFTDQSHIWPSDPQDQLLVLGAPADANVDLMWEAFLVFVEHLFQIDVCDENHAVWSEVTPAMFEDTVRARIEQTLEDPRLQGIWGEGRLAIVAPTGRVSLSEWSILLEMLEQADGDMQIGAADWPILALPSAATPDSGGTHRAEPAADLTAGPQSRVSPARIERANRHLPVAATPEQQTYLALKAAQPDGRHPCIAMEPVILDMPDKEAIRATIEALQERHESLFTTFVTHDDTPFIVLDDSTPPPLERTRVMNPMSSIAMRAAQKTGELAKSLHKSDGHWRACLIEARRQAAVVCVFSKTIADQSAVDLFRKELLLFYEMFRAGRDPEADTAPPALQYTDFAASARDSATAVAWWEQVLPTGLFAEADPALPFAAPVNRWEQSLPSDLTKQLLAVSGGDKATLEALLLGAFLRSLFSIQKTPSPWFILPVHDLRPTQAEGCLGQFTRLCPVWVQDLGEVFDPVDLAGRLAGLRAHDPLAHRDLALAMPGRIPARIPYLFEFTPHPSLDDGLDQTEDFSLTVRHAGDRLTARWAIRLDHPHCHQNMKLNRMFCAHLNAFCQELHHRMPHASAS